MTPIRARSASSFSAALTLVGFLLLPGALLRGEPLEDEPAVKEGPEARVYTVTVYELWGSAERSRRKPPKEIAKLIPKLKKQTGKNSFRPAGKPLVRNLRIEETLKKSLPQKYTAEWTLTLSEGKLALRQRLRNPKKRSSVLLLKRCPVITELTKIRQGSESFVLVVDFRTAKKK